MGAFKSFEHDGWEAVPDRYDDAFGDLTAQAAGPLLDAVGCGPGTRLLDVASGPGYVSAAAADRGAVVTGLDFAEAMVQWASRRHPRIEFRQGDAESLPFEDASFDAVVMNFGMLHLENPDKAVAEAARVLRPGGRYAFTVWAPPERAAGFRIVLQAVQRHGASEVALPAGPPFFRFSDPAECRRAMGAAGLEAPSVQEVSLLWSMASPEVLFERMRTATVRTAALLRAQSPQALQAIGAAITAGAREFERGRRIEIPMPAVLASATRR